jgi:hypothetical protein
LRNPDLLAEEIEKMNQPDSATKKSAEAELVHVRKRIEALPEEERRLVAGYRKGYYSDSVMRDEKVRVDQKRVAAEERRLELTAQLDRLDRALAYLDQVKDLTSRLAQGLDTLDFGGRRELLRLLVDEVVYDDGQLSIKRILPLRQLHPTS